jgi:cation diffusion facilitator CzcD-associated flavoprotein CzcO
VTDTREESQVFDAIVVGAGFGGLCALYRLRECGFRVRVLEKGDGVGGTWYWNRYPGARVDVHGIEYSYSFSKEIEQEWDWSEVMPTQPEIERYLNFVADRLDLRRDIQLDTTVVAARYDEQACVWTVETDNHGRFTAQFLISATGCLSAPLTPDIDGTDAFEGVSLFTSNYPREGFDFGGRRVGVVGTGSSGVQAIPVIAEEALELYVFQRSAAFTRPANNRTIDPQEMEAIKANYPELRKKLAESFSGTIHVGAVTVEAVPEDRRILSATPDQRRRSLEEHGWSAPWSWSDVLADVDANKAGVELYGELVRHAVHDPDVAASLVPHYPIGCKRPIFDTGYFECFNRDNVTLVDLRKDPIQRITRRGIETVSRHFDLDVIVWATGFVAITGALTRIDIRGRQDVSLRSEWADGPRTLLGLQSHGFPNLFMITGPGSPSVHINVVMAIEHHVEMIADLMLFMRKNGKRAVEPTEDAETKWIEHVDSLVAGTIRASEACDSWYLGSNVAGKRRKYMTYVGGQIAYRQECREIFDNGYQGFIFAS